MIIRNAIWTSAFVLCCLFSNGQFALTLPDNFVTENNYYIWGNGVSVFDFDKDGWDDITICQHTGAGVRAMKNNGDGTFSLYKTFATPGVGKHPTWVDYDNDGDYDFFFTDALQSKFLYKNQGNDVFTLVNNALNPMNSFTSGAGCSWGDYDRDGWLDLYIGSYNGHTYTNLLYHSDGDGTFTEVAQTLNVDNEFRWTLQPCFMDINQDGWQDIYVVNDAQDTCKMYINHEGIFTDDSELMGLNITPFGMCNSISDFDLDGDFDIYVTNTQIGNYLMENQDGVFTNSAEEEGVVLNEWSWGSLWIDYDLDGDDDLHVSSRSGPLFPPNNPFFVNDSTSLTPIAGESIPGDLFESYCSAKGDFNNDGRWDFVVTNRNPTSVAIWMNTTDNDNNWIKVSLEGTQSNRDGIGALLKCYHNGHAQILQTYCGESYLSQDSHTEIIGMGTDEMVDSLVVVWPSGWIDTYYNLDPHVHYQLTEGETFQVSIETNGISGLCGANDSLALFVDHFPEITWSTSNTDSLINVYAPGMYSVLVVNDFGFVSSDTMWVEDISPSEYQIDYTQPTCFGSEDGFVYITDFSLEELYYSWNGFPGEALQTGVGAGTLEIEVQNEAGCAVMHVLEILQPEPITFSIEADSILCYGESVELLAHAEGGTGLLISSWNTEELIDAMAGFYYLYAEDEMGCWSDTTITLVQPQQIEVINTTLVVCYGAAAEAFLELTGGNPPYSIDWLGQNPLSLNAGQYNVEIEDANGCISEHQIEIEQADSLYIEYELVENVDGQNGFIELEVSGGIPPYYFFWSNGSIGNPLVNVPAGYYQCMIEDSIGCYAVSPSIQLSEIAFQTEGSLPDASIWINQNGELLTIERKGNITEKLEVLVYDAMGRIVYQNSWLGSRIEVNSQNWSAGVYILGVGETTFKWLKP